MSQLPVPQGSLATYLVEINRFDLLSADDEHRLATRYQATGDIEAAQSLVTSNLRFVVKVAYEYAGYGLRMADLQSKRRLKSIAFPRQVCMYLARKLTDHSFEEIGSHFGGRDHTTVLYACQQIEERRARDQELDLLLEETVQKLKNLPR